MEDINMCDAFPLPAPSQATMDWLSSTGLHELAPRVGVVQWEPSETRCMALNSLRQEVMIPGESASAKTSPLRSLLLPTVSSASSVTQGEPYALASSSCNASVRRKPTPSRGRRELVDTMLDEPGRSMQPVVPQLADLIRNVVGAIDEGARLKKQHFDKQKKHVKDIPGSAPLGRTKSARPAHLGKRTSLSACASEELLDRTNVAPRPFMKHSGVDTGWSSHLLDARVTNVELQNRLVGPMESKLMRERDMAVDPSDDQPSRARTTLLKPKVPTARGKTIALSRQSSHDDSVTMPPPPLAVAVPVSRKVRSVKNNSTAENALPRACTPPPAPVSQPRFSGPTSSQPSSRPLPALGMRRTSTPGGNSASAALRPSQALPMKQRGFKIPSIRPPSAGSQPSSPSSSRSSREATMGSLPNPAAPSPPGQLMMRIPASSVIQPRSRSSSPPPEADSSYGELSIDLDAMEETMKQYDQA